MAGAAINKTIAAARLAGVFMAVSAPVNVAAIAWVPGRLLRGNPLAQARSALNGNGRDIMAFTPVFDGLSPAMTTEFKADQYFRNSPTSLPWMRTRLGGRMRTS